jgi:hypothetical protein
MFDPALFQDPHMFDSADNWRKAGFAVEGKGTQSDIMVASHPSVKGYLFKKYSKKISLKDQLKNYLARIHGADAVRTFIEAHQFTRLTVPRKYLVDLPPAFTHKKKPAFILAVDRMDLLPSEESKKLYSTLDHEGLRQLCETLRAYQGLDSGVRNLPFTRTGKIAFIDTERWDEKKKKHLHRIREYLTPDQRTIAESFFK